MRSRIDHIRTTPAVMVYLLKNLWRSFVMLLRRKGVQYALLGMLALSTLLLSYGWYDATAPQRAFRAYMSGDYNRSIELFASRDGAVMRFNGANALYREGRYEEAIALYSAIDAKEPLFAAAVWYNRGNTLVRLKEFAKAREAYARSLALHYDDAALENMMHILHAESQDHMLAGRQEGKKRAQDQPDERESEQSQKRKAGGGSNQQSTAERNRGAGSQGKKTEREMQLEFSNKGKSRLSSKQYELINQRSVHEKNPW